MEIMWTNTGAIESRIDAEYYKTEFLEASLALNANVPTKPFDELWTEANRIYIGIAGFREVDDESLYTPYLRPVDVSDEGFIGYDSLPWCKKEWLEEYGAKGCAKPGDLIVEVKGNTRKVAVVSDQIPHNCIVSGSSYRMQLSSDVDPLFVKAFMLSPTGQLLKRRLTSNTTINYIDPESFRNYRIPLPIREIQTAIANQLRKVDVLRELSQNAIAKGREILKDHLRLEEPTASRRPEMNWVSSNELGPRLDAWYFRPTFLHVDKTLQRLMSDGVTFKRLGTLAAVDYGYMPTEDYWPSSEGASFFRTTNFGDDLGVDLRDLKHVNPAARSNPNHCLHAGDVLVIQCGNYTGKICFIGDRISGWVYPSFALRIRPKVDCDSGFLAILLDSPVGQRQIEKEISITSVRPNTTKPAISSIRVPIIARSAQTLIGDCVRLSESYNAQIESTLRFVTASVESLIHGNLNETALVNEDNETVRWLQRNSALVRPRGPIK